MNKKAFTMLELVFVIVVLGILSALVIPRLDRDTRQEAIDNVISAIQHTQHLALIDDKTNPREPLWQKELWTIKFIASGDSFAYIIYSDTNHNGTAEIEETMVDTSSGAHIYDDGNGKVDSDESPNGFLYRQGVSNITFGEGCPADHFSFDRFGRLFSTNIPAGGAIFDGYMPNDCVMTMSFEEGVDAKIMVESETGYIKVLN